LGTMLLRTRTGLCAASRLRHAFRMQACKKEKARSYCLYKSVASVYVEICDT